MTFKKIILALGLVLALNNQKIQANDLDRLPLVFAAALVFSLGFSMYQNGYYKPIYSFFSEQWQGKTSIIWPKVILKKADNCFIAGLSGAIMITSCFVAGYFA